MRERKKTSRKKKVKRKKVTQHFRPGTRKKERRCGCRTDRFFFWI